MLLRTRKIKKVLIVTNEFNNFLCNKTPLIEQCGKWQTKLEILLHEYEIKFHPSVSEDAKKNIFSNYTINGITYDNFEESFICGLFTHDELNLFDCIIFDDTCPEVLSLNCMSLFEDDSYKNRLWFLSNYGISDIEKPVSDLFNKSKITTLERTVDQINELTQKVFYHDYFLPLDTENEETIYEIETEGREVIDNLFGIGNYLRIQPNAFQIIQEVQKKSNFGETFNYSRKTSLLLYHISRLLSREDRILIYSQFDENGITNIEKILNSENIKTLKFGYSDSVTEIKEKQLSGGSDKEKIVYLTNIKPNNIQFTFPKVRHIINFDSWWNPLTRWQTETKVEPENQKPITVFNYYYLNTIENKLVTDLISKGMFDKNIIGHLKAEKLYKMFDENYWADFFEINHEKSHKEINYTEGIFSIVQLVEFVKLFLSKLGFENISAKATDMDDSYLISANTQEKTNIEIAALYGKFINSRTINKLIRKRNKNKPLAIITNGSISQTKVLLPPDVSLVNGKLLSRYLELL